MWKPLLYRALVALVFGLVTVFWQNPSTTVMSVAGGLYLVGTAFAVLLLDLSFPTSDGRIKRALRVEHLGLLALSVFALSVHQTWAFVAAASAGLGIAGLCELYLGWTHRRRLVLARDWLLTGGVNTAAAVILPFFATLEAHALLGVIGGSAIIIGVMLLLAALTYRHEASAPAGSAEAVN